MLWDAVRFAFKRLIGFWLSVIPRAIATSVITAAISGAICFGLYYLVKMLHIIPEASLNLTFWITALLAVIPPMISTSIVVLRVAIGKAMNKPVPLWVTPIVRPAIKIVLSSILASLLSLVATIALIVPGIYVWIRLFFAKFCVVDHGHGPIKSLKCSWSLTRGAKSDIWKISFIITAFVLCVIGIWVWMGMPIQGPQNPSDLITKFRNLGNIKINWYVFTSSLLKLIAASLALLFMAHLYAKLSQKDV